MNEQITTLIESMKDERKRVRQKAVEEMLKLVQQNIVDFNLLKDALLGNSPDLTSSVIQIMCRLGADETKNLLYWLKDYRDVHNPILNEHEWLRIKKEDSGERIYRSVKKYVKHNLRFQDLFVFLQELYVESIEMRKGLISEIRTHYPDLIKHLDFYFVAQQITDWKNITVDTYKKGEQMELENDASFIQKLPIALRELYIYKLYFYQFWLDLLRDLSFGFVYYTDYKPIFPIEDILILKENAFLDLICCSNSRFRLHVLNALEQLTESNYMILKGFETTSKELLWEKINTSRDWYKNTSVEYYSDHLASKALQALLILGDEEALYLFKDICEYYDSRENGVPCDASRIYIRFPQTVKSVNQRLI